MAREPTVMLVKRCVVKINELNNLSADYHLDTKRLRIDNAWGFLTYTPENQA